MSTFRQLTDKELDEVRKNDNIITPFDAWARLHFSTQSLGDITRHLAACKITETEAMGHFTDALVYTCNIAQHSAESLGLCTPEDIQEQVSDDFRQNCHAAIKWLAEYIQSNKKSVPSTQLGGENRFAVEFDVSTLHALFQLAKNEDD